MTEDRPFEPPRSEFTAIPLQGGYVARQCPVRAQLDHDTTRDGVEEVAVGVAQQARIDAGRELEARVFTEIVVAHPDAVRISAFSRDDAQAQTHATLQSDATIVIEGYLPDDIGMRRAGRPDLLVRHGTAGSPLTSSTTG